MRRVGRSLIGKQRRVVGLGAPVNGPRDSERHEIGDQDAAHALGKMTRIPG